MTDSCCTYEPFSVGRGLRIVPPGTPAVGQRRDLILARGAFGSGEHDTTASCLELLEDLHVAGARVFDFGCGTGVLAVAALTLGAAHAVCCDVSSEAMTCTARNAALNGVTDRVELLHGSLETVVGRQFDLLLANIYGDIILALGRQLIDKARPGGHLLLSGILWEDNFAVRHLLEAQRCRLLANRMLAQHSTVLAQRMD